MKTKNLPMMRTISVMVCVLWCINIMAQDSIPFFSCAQIQKDNEALTTIKKKYKGSKKKWGAAIQEYHPLENGNIQYTYIVEATDNFNIKTMMNNTQAWFGYITSSELASVKNVDDENHIIEATTGFDNVAEASGYGSISIVGVVMNYRISFKANRIKFVLWVSHYNIGTASNFAKNKTEVIPIAEAYPVNPNGKHKSSLGAAFINVNAYCPTVAQSYLEYMEKHRCEDLKKKDTDW